MTLGDGFYPAIPKACGFEAATLSQSIHLFIGYRITMPGYICEYGAGCRIMSVMLETVPL